MDSIALFYGHVASNVGDLAINRGQVELLRATYPKATINVILLNARKSAYRAGSLASFGSDEKVRFIDVDRVNGDAIAYAMEPASWLTACGVEDADLIVLAAGEHLFGYRDNDNLINLFWRTLPAFAAQQAGKPCILMPSTFGPFETDESLALIKELLRTQAHLAARDNRSLSLLNDIEPSRTFEACLDPAFFIPPPTHSGTTERRTVALVMRSDNWGIRLAADARKDFQEDEAGLRTNDLAFRFSLELCRKLLAESECAVTIIVQTDADQTIADAVVADLSDAAFNLPLEVKRAETIDGYLDTLEKVDAIVASRFHALILAMICGKPGFGVYFDVHGHKIPGLMELLDQQGDCLRLTESNIDQVVESAFSRIVDGDLDFERSAARINALREKTSNWLKSFNVREVEQRIAGLSQPLMAIAGRLMKGQLEADRARADQERLDREKAERKSAEYTKELNFLRNSVADYKNRVPELELSDRALKNIQRSASYRLGKAFVDGASSPGQFLRIPSRAWAIYTDQRKASSAPAASGGLSAKMRQKISRQFQKRGVEGVIQCLEAEKTSRPQDLILGAADVVRRMGDRQAEVALLKRIPNSDRSEVMSRALYWAAQSTGDLSTAWQAIRDLEHAYGSGASDAQLDVLAKMRRSPAFQLSLFDLVNSVPTQSVEPVANRICYVLHNSLPYSSGGYAARAHGLGVGLEQAGLEVVTLTRPGYPLDSIADIAPNDIPLEGSIDGIRHMRILSPQRSGMQATAYVSAAADALTEKFSELQTSMVMAASNYQTALPALIAARRLGLPFFYEIRGFWEITRISREPEFGETPAYKIQEIMEAETAKRADHVFTLTGPMKQELMRRGVPADQITVLPNSCDPSRFKPRDRDHALAARLGIPEHTPVIGYIGSFVQYEGLENLAQACAILAQSGMDFRLLLVGNENVSGNDRGPITEEVLRVANQEGLGDRLIMPGRVPHEEVEAYYSLIDIAPFPRKPQPVTEMVSPMKPLEAFAMEKAVVVSSVRAMAEMVRHEETGLIYEKGNVQALADALGRLIKDSALREKLGKAGRTWVEQERTWEATARIATDRIRMTVQKGGR